jgi:hypothetical protein
MKKSVELLYELLKLRDTDYEMFMDKLYEAMTTEFLDIVKSKVFEVGESEQVFKSMIKHFERKEEYEKCDVLLHLLKSASKN